MSRLFVAPIGDRRCAAVLALRDGTLANCMHVRTGKSRHCWQHIRKARHCDVPDCPIANAHIHCPECGSTEHRANGCDMED